MPDRVNQRTTDAEASLDIDPVELGTGSSAATDSTAVGVNAVSSETGAVAIGDGTEADRADTATFGDRDIELADGRKIVFPPDQGVQTLLDLLIQDAPAGESHSAAMKIAGSEILRVGAEADGNGGIQNGVVTIPVDLAVSGDTTEIEDVITGAVEIEDGSGATQFLLDATQSPPVIDFGGNNADGLDRINPSGGTLQIDGDLTISGEITEGSAL